MNVTFTEASGLADSIYGKIQSPIKMFIEKRGEDLERNSMIKTLFKMNTSNNFGDTYVSMTAMDGFRPVPENGAYPADNMQESFKKVITYYTWKDSFGISKEMIEDAKLMDLSNRPAAFMAGYNRTREQFGAFLFGTAMAGKKSGTFFGQVFDTTTADGEALFSKNHPSAREDKKKLVQTNMFSDAFSVKALSHMETAMQLFRGDSGEILDVSPDTIIIPNDADLKQEVFAAIGADKEPTTANNAFSFQYGRWNVVTWSYLNKYVAEGKKPWILADTRYNETYCGAVWTDRVQLELNSTIDENTDANIWKGRSRFNAGFVDWRAFACGGLDGGSQLITG